MDFNLDFDDTHRRWLLLAAGADPQLCLQDPGIGEDRYVFVEATADALFPVARGSRSWADAVADESVRLFGNPDLVTQPPGWFGPAEGRSDVERSTREGHEAMARRRIAARRPATLLTASDRAEASAERPEPAVGVGR